MKLCACAGWCQSVYFAHVQGTFSRTIWFRNLQQIIFFSAVAIKVLFSYSYICPWRPYNLRKSIYETIMKTRLYNFDPLKPHCYIVKLGFTGVYIIFLISSQNIDRGYTLEPPRRGGSNEYPQSMFWAETWKISEFFICKFSFFGGKIFIIFELACFRNGVFGHMRTAKAQISLRGCLRRPQTELFGFNVLMKSK